MAANRALRTASLQALLDQTAEAQAPKQQGSRRLITHQLQEDAEAYRSAVKRAETSTYVDTLNLKGNSDVYATRLFQWTLSRLDQAQLRTNRMVQQHFQYMLPNQATSRDQLAIFDALHYRPMTVSNHDLSQILSLELSTATSPPTPEGEHFYIRSWTLTAGELRTVLSEMTESGNVYEEMEEWRKVVDLYNPVEPDQTEDMETISSVSHDASSLPTAVQPAVQRGESTTAKLVGHAATQPTQYFTIRYVGKVAGPGRPYDRYIEDLTTRTSGVLHEFQQILDRLFPAVEDAAQVHLLKDASLGLSGSHNKMNTDDVERFLIEYFDHATLLNRQRGGYFTSYVPLVEDVDAFRDMDLQFYCRFLAGANLPSPDLSDQLFDHYKRIQVFANEHSAETGTCRYRFGDDLRNSMLRQATPHVYKKTAPVLVIVGKDITLHSYLRGKTFFEDNGQASNLTADYLRRLTRLDPSVTMGAASHALNTAAFPFVDLWQWLRHRQLPEAASFLRQYFAIVRPLIAVSFSRKVNELTKANFMHQFGAKFNSFIATAGEISLQYYEVDESGQPDPDSAFINIPHIHPGYDKYGPTNAVLRRVLDLTWHKTFLVTSIAMDKIDQLITESRPMPSRAKFCQEVIESVEKLSRDKNYQPFFTNLDQAKNQLLNQHRRYRVVIRRRKIELRSNTELDSGYYDPDDVRPVMNPAGRLTMAALGQAEGEPYSERRHDQLLRYWVRNIPELHIHVAHDDDLFSAWKDEFLPLQEGQFFYMQVLSRLPLDDYIRHLLRNVRPEWAEDDTWMEETRHRTAAELRCGMWFHRNKLLPGGERLLIKSHFPDQYASAYDMQGRQVGVVESTGSVLLRWRRDDGSSATVLLVVKPAIPGPLESAGSRFVSFTEHGIDIVNAAGEPFRFQIRKDRVAPASVPKAALAGTWSGAEGTTNALELWKAVRTAHGHDVKEEEVENARDWGDKKGVKAISRVMKREEPQQNRPPKPEDALYPLDKFLEQRFPNGGAFRTASADRLIDSTEDLQAFLSFLTTPEFAKHPYQSFWHAALSRNPPDVALLGKNMCILRSSVQERTQRQSTTPGTKSVNVKETIYHLGPPGSALANPFETEASGDADDDDIEGSIAGSAAGKSHKKLAAKPKAVSGRGGKKAAKNHNDEDVAEESGSAEKMLRKPKPKLGAKGSKSPRGLTAGDDDDDFDDDSSAFAKPLAKKATGLRRTKTRPEVAESMYGSAAQKRRRISETEEDAEGGEKEEQDVGEDVIAVQKEQKKKKKRGRPAKKAKPAQDDD